MIQIIFNSIRLTDTLFSLKHLLTNGLRWVLVGPQYPGNQGRCLTDEEEEDDADEHDGRVGAFSLPWVQLFAPSPGRTNGTDEQPVQDEQNHKWHPAHEDHVEPRVVKDLEPHVLANGSEGYYDVIFSGRGVARAPATPEVADRPGSDLDRPVLEELGKVKEKTGQGQD